MFIHSNQEPQQNSPFECVFYTKICHFQETMQILMNVEHFAMITFCQSEKTNKKCIMYATQLGWSTQYCNVSI